ncbi:hypothetical protein V496_00593 [Pseudogymnoascus sp. VKM F-4515 (FW-2607)]|nr:hypothetical protein V496_00593 [Pseudogymnoascus sp. VKM F-4515 (FW-2607)]
MRSIAAHEGKVGMAFVLFPDMDAAVYNRVRYVDDILLGIHTVCSLDIKAAKEGGRDQYLANIALKVNCNLLGVNQSLDVAKLGIICEGKTMVVGIDVTHPSPGSLSNAPSGICFFKRTLAYKAPSNPHTTMLFSTRSFVKET